MIEQIDNFLQIILAGACTAYSAYRAVASGRREWILLGLFSGAFFFGDLYYTLNLILYEETYADSNIPYLCWYTSFYFMILLILYIKGDKSDKKTPAIMSLIPVFTAGMCAFFILKGDVLSNLISFVLMTLLLWNAADGLQMLRSCTIEQQPVKRIYLVTFLFCFAEYALWTSSCFWMGDTIFNPYFWFDTLISVCFVLYILAFRKAVDG